MGAVRVHQGTSGQQRLLEGINTLADAVTVTLGPGGRHVIIGKIGGSQPLITKDGVTVAMKVSGDEDPIVDIGMQMIRTAAMEAYKETGDGTTTATLLAQSLINTGIGLIENGMQPGYLIECLSAEADIVVKAINSQATPISISGPEVKQIATIAANNDPELGALIHDCISYVGAKGITKAEISQNATSYVEKKTGMRIERGYISTAFITNERTDEAVLNNPLILVYDRKINTLTDVSSAMADAIKAQRSMLIIADDVDGEALATMIKNNNRFPDVRFAAIKAPNYMYRKEMLADIAIFTGATFISEESGANISRVSLKELGSAEVVTISATETTIIGGNGDKKAIDARIKNISDQLTDHRPEQAKAFLQDRYAGLSASTAVLYIGKTINMDMQEKRERIDDALKATKAALEEGIVPGGGMAYLRSISAFTGSKSSYAAVCLIAPILKVSHNAGYSLEIPDYASDEANHFANEALSKPENYGFNAKNGQWENLIESGVIDPVKVVRIAFEKAIQVAKVVLSTSCIVTDIA